MPTLKRPLPLPAQDRVIAQLIHSIAQAVTTLSKSKRQPADILVAYILRAVVLDPRNNIDVDAVLSGNDVENLIELCTKRLLEEQSIELECVKMQVFFDTKWPQQGDYLSRERQRRHAIASTFLRGLCDTTIVHTLPDMESFFRNVVSYIMAYTCASPSEDVVAARQVAAALESVFPHAEISTFVRLPRPDKEKQLFGLMQLVTGIRIFNSFMATKDDIQSIPERIENLPELCSNEIEETMRLIDREINDAEIRCSFLRSECALYSDPSDRPDAVTDSLVFSSQLIAYLDTIKVQIAASIAVLKELDERVSNVIKALEKTCRSRSAVPVEQVYPRFMALAALWEGFQDELVLDTLRHGMAATLVEHSARVATLWPKYGLKLHKDKISYVAEPKASEEAIVRTAASLQDIVTHGGLMADVLHPGNVTQYYKLPVEYSGFCPSTVFRTRGVVVPGNWNLGILKYQDKLFVFATLAEAAEFIASPKEHIHGIIDLAKQKIGLVQLLQLYSQFPSVSAMDRLQSFSKHSLLSRKPLSCDVGVQCDTHILDSYKDPQYEWNEWEMRRKALLLVSLRNKVTHAAQTVQSNFRRDTSAQVYLKKTSQTQTMAEGSNKMPESINMLKIPKF